MSLLDKSDAIQALKAIRIEANDPYNRLHSISEDASFVSSIKSVYFRYPLLANQRCGAWYVDPLDAPTQFIYFKSTDGHFGQWAFNLRRSNLHILPMIMESGGVIIVDSTRNGKRLPDALSKTVPIWCAVINESVRIRYKKDTALWQRHSSLRTPPQTVSQSEHAQIAVRISGWAEDLLNSSFPLPDLQLPLRPFWVTPDSSTFPGIQRKENEFSSVICLSASKSIKEGIERRAHGFSYIQGSGDDHEAWSLGLTPELFWKYRQRILSCSRAALTDLISEVTRSDDRNNQQSVIPIMAVSGKITIIKGTPVSLEQFPYKILIKYQKNGESHTEILSTRTELQITLPKGKSAQSDYLHRVLPAVESVRRDWKNSDQTIAVVDENCLLDASVGIMMLLIVQNFDEFGNEVASNRKEITKAQVRKSLQWIQQSCPDANPSRTTMKRLNEFLISSNLPLHRKPPPTVNIDSRDNSLNSPQV